MLVGTKFCLCTPAKCGTRSVEAMLRPDHASLHYPRHGTVHPFDGTRRIMLVRHPHDRLLSHFAYNHRLRERGAGIWAAKYSESLASYCEAVLWHRANAPYWIHTCNLTEMAAVFRPDVVFKLEHGLDALRRYLKKRFGLPLPRTPHVNRTRRGPRGDLNELSLALRRRVLDWLAPDLETFDYEGIRLD